MKLSSNSFGNLAEIPVEFAFGKRGDSESPIALSGNRNPHLHWDNVPNGTRSFALLCIDPDVPSRGETVNRKDIDVPIDLLRTEFFHWIMIDIPADCREIAAGSCSDGITAHGKTMPVGPGNSRQGLNDYTGWFADDADMKGDYLGYDGPCPPFNDPRTHRYFFRLFALDVDQLDVAGKFTAGDALAAMHCHVLGEAHLQGTYCLYYKS